MKRLPRLIIVLVVLLMVTLSFLISADFRVTAVQKRTFSPPIIKVELSGVEPVPPGITGKLLSWWSGSGGENFEATEQIRWTDVPPVNSLIENIYYFIACGVPEMEPPAAILTNPDGITTRLKGDYGALPSCFYWVVDFGYGMRLGKYHIDVQFPRQKLTYDWTIDYSQRPMIARYMDYSKPERRLIMGFKPRQVVQVYFYAGDRGDTYSFFAMRHIKVDDNGAAIIDPLFTRSVSDQYVDIAITLYDSYRNEVPCLQFNLRSRMLRGQTGKTAPDKPISLQSQPGLRTGNPNVWEIASLEPETIFDVLDGPVCADGILWWKVNTFPKIGWIGEGQGSAYWIAPYLH